MAKDKFAKERKRAKRKQAERARDQQRNAENRRAAEMLIEGIDRRTPRGLAALYSVPRKSMETLPHQPRLARVAAPPHFAAMKTNLDRYGATRYLKKFADAMFDLVYYDEVQPTGFAVVCDARGEKVVEPIAMPSQLLFISPDVKKWLARELHLRAASLIAWLAWDFTEEDSPIQVVFALDNDGQFALWFVDEEDGWHAASQPEEYLDAARRAEVGRAEESGLTDLLGICGVTRSPEGTRASADDPCAVAALEALNRSQKQLLQAFFDLADRNEESDAALDFVAAENERIGTLERDLAKLQRRHAQAEQERDQARATLARQRADLGRQSKAAPPYKELTLVNRLAAVFD